MLEDGGSWGSGPSVSTTTALQNVEVDVDKVAVWEVFLLLF